MLESLSPMTPALALLVGAFVQITYCCALALRLIRPKQSRAWRWAALGAGCLALAAAWVRSDIVFLVGQLLLCLAYLLQPELGAAPSLEPEADKGARHG